MYTELREVMNEFKDELKADLIGEMRNVINAEFKDELKVEITGEFCQEMRGMEDRLTTRLDGIDDRLDGIEDRLIDVETDVASIKLTLENEIKPNICKIAEGYTLLEERLDREAAEEREYRRRVDYRLAALANQN